ncbi:DUF2380 domain-containing protein [Myxococcus sp. K15C18031901]|uniref:DUF2380 domain-containing protein n=1 Tax=Myxococcus dinghuensis TaxID=2906761 RepID=UPI0020A6EB65|nr:DUF2380 domain-containing protein [Myxococcus dinghuensis]MCP3105164.1 DUF2380 domain-containing protein [Myxococcus dinghuensis]
MRADALLLAMALLTTGCASVTQPSGPFAGSDARQRLWRHAGPRDDATLAGPGNGAGAVGGGERNAALTRQAILESIDETKGSLEDIQSTLSKLRERAPVFNGRRLGSGVFTRYLDHGAGQVTWMRGALGSATTLTGVASEVGDAGLQWGLLRMTGPRLQAAMFGTLLLATWVDFLQLSDALLRECPMCSDEKVFADLHRVQTLMEPTLSDLSALDTERVEAAALEVPQLMGKLSREFNAIHANARSAMEQGGKVGVAAQVLEMPAMLSTLKLTTPRPPASAPATLGEGLVMSAGGVMAGSRIVVSAEWVEMMRRLVQAGVLSIPVVSAAVRIHGGQVLMAQAPRDLPGDVREALGDSPEVRGMHVTNKAKAGMPEAPKHHVLPKEHREWFEQRGFTGDLDIDQFCVRLEQAHHEAIHGGGNWRLGRTWPGEWNQLVMRALRNAELRAGRMLTSREVLEIVAERMTDYRVPMNFSSGRGP